MANEEDVEKWRLEYCEDDAAISLARERLMELGFLIESEQIERKVLETGDVTEVRWKLKRIRRSEGNVLLRARSGVAKWLDAMKSRAAAFKVVK